MIRKSKCKNITDIFSDLLVEIQCNYSMKKKEKLLILIYLYSKILVSYLSFSHF